MYNKHTWIYCFWRKTWDNSKFLRVKITSMTCKTASTTGCFSRISHLLWWSYNSVLHLMTSNFICDKQWKSIAMKWKRIITKYVFRLEYSIQMRVDDNRAGRGGGNHTSKCTWSPTDKKCFSSKSHFFLLRATR